MQVPAIPGYPGVGITIDKCIRGRLWDGVYQQWQLAGCIRRDNLSLLPFPPYMLLSDTYSEYWIACCWMRWFQGWRNICENGGGGQKRALNFSTEKCTSQGQAIHTSHYIGTCLRGNFTWEKVGGLPLDELDLHKKHTKHDVTSHKVYVKAKQKK